MRQVSRSEFDSELRRWFLADGLPDAEVDRLYRGWQERSKQRPYINWLEDQFYPRNRAAEGAAWWEERQAGEAFDPILPITEEDRVKMWLSSDPLARPPRPRPWCPDILVGRWRLTAARYDFRDNWMQPTAPRQLVLHGDGRMMMEGDTRYQGWTWKAHRSGDSYYLYVGPEGEPLPTRWPADLLDDGDMELSTSEVPHYLLWRRSS
jgi:hypothetical protein